MKLLRSLAANGKTEMGAANGTESGGGCERPECVMSQTEDVNGCSKVHEKARGGESALCGKVGPRREDARDRVGGLCSSSVTVSTS